MDLFKKYHPLYFEQGYSVVPGRYGSKMPAIRQWQTFCKTLNEPGAYMDWAHKDKENNTPYTSTNLDICMGPASGLVAVDVDTADPELIEYLRNRLPDAPEKVGRKGFTRFYKWHPSLKNSSVKMGGEVIFELLAEGKKTTIPPSRHPSGIDYKWTTEQTLENCKVDDIPMLPPAILSVIADEIKAKRPNWDNDASYTGDAIKLFNGRNDALSNHASALIFENKSIEEVIGSLVAFDRENHEIPLFSDPNEFNHTEPLTNALTFYANHLNTFNKRNADTNKAYAIPYFKTLDPSVTGIIDVEKIRQQAKRQKKLNHDLPVAQGVIKSIQQWILENSPIPQPKFALSAALSLVSTAISRKARFSNIAPNLFVLNVAASSSGKDAPQKLIRHLFQESPRGRSFLGYGSFSSDSAILDALEEKPVSLSIMDEASKILNPVSNAGAHYEVGMAETLCEVYTSALDYFPGKKMSSKKTKDGEVIEVIKGKCEHPHLNLMLSTTDAGIKESLSLAAINKGLLGRFMVFKGDNNAMVQNIPHIRTPASDDIYRFMDTWFTWGEEPGYISFGSSTVELAPVTPTTEVSELLGKLSKELHEQKLELPDDSIFRPLIGRVFIQTVKLAMIHCCSKILVKPPGPIYMDIEDFTFGKELALLLYKDMRDLVETNVYSSPYEKKLKQISSIIENAGYITETELHHRISMFDARARKQVLEDLIDNHERVIKKGNLYVWSAYV